MPSSKPPQARKSARQSRSKVTVDAILEAASRLFAQGGLEDVTTNRIAEVAGVSIGSLYQYFPSKQAILGELIDQHAQQTMTRVVAQLSALAAAPIEQWLRQMVSILLEADTIDSNLHRLLLDKVPEVGRTAMRQTELRQMTAAVHSILETRRDDLRPTNLQLAAFVVVQALEAVTNAAVIECADQLDNPELVDEIATLAARYLLK